MKDDRVVPPLEVADRAQILRASVHSRILNLHFFASKIHQRCDCGAEWFACDCGPTPEYRRSAAAHANCVLEARDDHDPEVVRQAEDLKAYLQGVVQLLSIAPV